MKLVLNLHFAKIAISESKNKTCFAFAERQAYLCAKHKNSKKLQLLRNFDVII